MTFFGSNWDEEGWNAAPDVKDTEKLQRIREASSNFHMSMEELGGCGDGNCIIVKPQGMHTNGGCRCNTDRYKMMKYASRSNYYHRLIAKILEE